jgi:hypothetical protein
MGFHEKAAEEARSKARPTHPVREARQKVAKLRIEAWLESMGDIMGRPVYPIPEIEFGVTIDEARDSATWTWEGYRYRASFVDGELEDVELQVRGGWHRVRGEGIADSIDAIGRAVAGLDGTGKKS